MKWIVGRWSYSLLLTLLILAGCSKRIDEPLATAPFYHNNNPGSAGSIRLVDLSPAEGMQLAVNDRKLTLFSSRYPGSTPWFTSGFFGYGALFTIPDSLFDAKGDALVDLYYLFQKTAQPVDGGFNNVGLDSTVLQMSLTEHNDPGQPRDIFFYDAWQGFYPSGIINTQLSSFSAARAISPSSQPDHFKIRLINFTGKPVADVTNRLTLTYANGSPVDAKTTSVTYPGVSDYVELPYGTYQFKIKDQDGNALTLAGDNLQQPSLLRTYNPGGVYTLVAYHSNIQPPGVGPQLYIPTYSLLTDIAPSALPNYIRIQAIHAVPNFSNLHFSVDGHPLGDLLSFGQYTEYGVFSIGPHKLQLTDGNGKEVAAKVLSDSYPLDNLSVWAYPLNGAPQLLVTNNDMSMSYYDQDFSSIKTPVQPRTGNLYPMWTMGFLNLSAGVPYASFIDNTGDFYFLPYVHPSNPAAWLHVGTGAVLDDNSVVTGTAGTGQGGAATTISAYDSPPGTDPGKPLNLTLDHPLVADSYPAGSKPVSETGVYTIALIGAAGTGDTLRMITIKHNK